VALTILLVLGLAALLRRTATARWAVGALVVICIWWNLGLIAAFALRVMDRQRVEPVRNARAVFITLPRMAPELAYRYFFDRRSFYAPRADGGH
jgi:hypothetical protein